MKVLIVGNGGREHALLWRLAADSPESEFYITRGNPGMAGLARSVDVGPTDVGAVVRTANEIDSDLVVVGPEVPLADGLADSLIAAGRDVFGPGAGAARIESSKVFSKQLMRDAGVPSASFEVFTELGAALSHIGNGPEQCVVKADGLAAGKGAIVCRSRLAARDAVNLILADRAFGEAGAAVVIEEMMTGEELSVLALADGRNVVPLVPSQDHKAVGEGDTGPNTGGMGSYAPVAIATPLLMGTVMRRIMEPVVAELALRGTPYRGCLYAGLMITADGPKVVEFNCRFGDPETQVVLPLLEGNLLELMKESAVGSLSGAEAGVTDGAAVCVVMASGGYPGGYQKGKRIEFAPELDGREDIIVYHAGTSECDGSMVTAGGRVLGVTGLGGNVTDAAARAYEGVDLISFDGGYCRRDIAWREIERLKKKT
ncbi:MAG: phosphoribosylamine--glycine ligase [Candidatus Glassbacteria bacterium]|nr:phosphoribosylamine--glycine ligase [Candidatus Glassbacteria bacterium]